jgi:Peptidase S24-like
MNHPEPDPLRVQDLTLPNAVVRDLMQTALQRGVPFRLRALGWSMSPLIRAGDVVFINPIQNREPVVGQVVAFIQPENGLLLIHRIICRQGSLYLIQGDNMRGRTDGQVPYEAILGCVTQVIRNGRRVCYGRGLLGYLIAEFSRLGLLTAIFDGLRVLSGRRASPGT